VNTYLAIVTEDGIARHANIVLAPHAHAAEILLKQAWPPAPSPVTTVYTAHMAGSVDGQNLLKRLAGNLQLGYPLIYAGRRQVQITMDIPEDVTVDDLRTELEKRWPQPTVVTVKDTR
jgi:hypothetical protein